MPLSSGQKMEATDSSEILEADKLNKWRQIPKYSNIQNVGLTYFIFISTEDVSGHSALCTVLGRFR
jgi:hypothetical protein